MPWKGEVWREERLPEHSTAACAPIRQVEGLWEGSGEEGDRKRATDLRTFKELPAGQPGWAIGA